MFYTTRSEAASEYCCKRYCSDEGIALANEKCCFRRFCFCSVCDGDVFKKPSE